MKEQPLRRGKATSEALYDLHKEMQNHKNLKAEQQKLNEKVKVEQSQFKNIESQGIRVNAFTKEFRGVLAELLKVEIDPELMNSDI